MGPADATAVFAAYQDPAIQRWHVRLMEAMAEASAWIRSRRQRWRAESGVDWAVTVGSVMVGRVGIKRFDLSDCIGELA
jgi:[ribosomal protein S5]-alanine N-acetyltransferase